MKIQNTPKIQLNNDKKQTIDNKSSIKPSFKGGELVTTALNFIQTNQAVGATLVDAGCMCMPRTIVDFTRSPEAGWETARREFSSNINDAALGAYGLGSAFLLSGAFNSKYGVKANKMFIDSKTIDILAGIRQECGDLRSPENLNKYLYKVFNNTTAFSPNAGGCDPKGNVSIDIITQDKLVKRLSEELLNKTVLAENKPRFLSNEWKQQIKDKKELYNYIKSLLINSTGTEGDYKIKHVVNGKEIISSIPVKEYVDNLLKLTNSFMNEKVVKSFDEAIRSGSIMNNSFTTGLKRLNVGTAVLGIALCSAIGAAVQPINMYLTKKKTGKTGFVGGGEEDKSEKFIIKKKLVAAAALLLSMRSIGKYSNILSSIQFKGIVPTIEQFKLVYGITIFSRLLSARNDNELRESSIKDSLGFANWLILGGFVSKLTALGMENLSKFKENGINFIKYNKEDSKNWPKWIKGALVSREEVLHDALKNAGISVIENGKALTISQMLKKIPEITDLAAKKLVKSRLKALTIAQFAGYAWSALALGFAVPKLNIAITNAVEGRKKQPELNDKEQTIASKDNEQV